MLNDDSCSYTGADGTVGVTDRARARRGRQHRASVSPAIATPRTATRCIDPGIEPVPMDIHSATYDDLPDGITHVFHAGAALGKETATGCSDWK